MKGIIRKKVLALFSAVGLAGSTASVTAQVLKGSEPAPAQKTESQIKLDKNKQENNATKGQATIKNTKINTAADAGSKDAAKFKKNKSENAASKDVVTEKDRKAGTDAITVKQKSAIKFKKGASETNATQKETYVKGGKTAAGANAAQSEANQKAGQTTPK
jgi:hypothetical protein